MKERLCACKRAGAIKRFDTREACGQAEMHAGGEQQELGVDHRFS